jgi:hypothetical protein
LVLLKLNRLFVNLILCINFNIGVIVSFVRKVCFSLCAASTVLSIGLCAAPSRPTAVRAVPAAGQGPGRAAVFQGGSGGYMGVGAKGDERALGSVYSDESGAQFVGRTTEGSGLGGVQYLDSGVQGGALTTQGGARMQYGETGGQFGAVQYGDNGGRLYTAGSSDGYRAVAVADPYGNINYVVVDPAGIPVTYGQGYGDPAQAIRMTYGHGYTVQDPSQSY